MQAITLVQCCHQALIALEACEDAPPAPADLIDREWLKVQDTAIAAKDALFDLGLALSAGLKAIEHVQNSPAPEGSTATTIKLFGTIEDSWSRVWDRLDIKTRSLTGAAEECVA